MAYRGEIIAPMGKLAVAAGVGMAVLSWLHLSPQSMAATAPMVYSGCMFMYGGNTSVIAGIFYAAWAAHLFEAIYALVLLSRNGWLRIETALPWFTLTLVFGYPSLGRLLKAVKTAKRK